MGHIVLVGLMGSGKTTVGRALADALGLPFSDSDRYIEGATGKTVRELAGERGVEAMHRLEAEHLLVTLAQPEPSVIAAASSTIDDPACREALARPGVTVVWLRAKPGILARRFAGQRHRPRFGRRPAALLADQAAERYPLYEALEPIVVETDTRRPADTAAAALAAVRRSIGGSEL